MDSQAIAKLTRESISRLTSDEYLTAHNDPTTGKEFASKVNEIENGPRTPSTRPVGNVRGEDASTPAQAQSYDPSFDDEEQPAPAPVAAQPAASVPAEVTDFSNLPLLEHSYQPEVKDKKTGKMTPIGGRQVFKYRTVNDPNDSNSLVMQLQSAHAHSSARLRTVARDQKLSSIGAAGTPPRFEPEAEMPTTLEGLGAELKAQRQQSFLLSVRAALAEFQAGADWEKYRHDPENGKSLILAIERLGLSPAEPASYFQAMEHMREYLREAPAPVAPVPAVAPTPASVAAPAPAARPSTVTHMGTGLSSADQTSGPDPFEVVPVKVQGQLFTMPDGKKQVLTARDLQRMSTDVMKRLLRSPDNARKADVLWQQLEEAKAAARGR